MAKVIWSPRALQNLDEICEYIAKDSPQNARSVGERIIAAVERIPDFPEAGSIVPEFDRPDLRERFVHKFRVVYRVQPHVIEVVTIWHGARPMPNDLA